MSPINISKPALPLLSLTKDLSPFLLEYMYVGFSSSAGYFRADYYLLDNWVLNTRLKKLGLLCAHAIAAARPSMCTVVQYLEGRAQLPDNLGDIIKSRDFREASNEQNVQLPTSVTLLTFSEPFTSPGR
ncbi:hypothetical protein RHSIM_Rhsim09G0147900 [Rhododendron simsii]|uniref:Uncharacterized protein n=1 Tax=Rhododendron simsii TaxID=118357 RepID=A0A834GCM9_RHOSS|nr:hypothetical protein RHSIM_Rhsim09G0147900 [Rhododendron simsii]